MIPSAGTLPTPQCDNIYSQEIVYWKYDTLLMFYGGYLSTFPFLFPVPPFPFLSSLTPLMWEGQNNYCHDQIFLAYSADGGVSWRKYTEDEKPVPVLAV